MTAVVGILNKQAIAVAADSAVTISGNNGRKIFNHANKIFRLSYGQPVGIMIYNSANFMQTPWEILIKVYREQLGKKVFPKLEDYQKDFLKFLKNKNYYTDSDGQKQACLEFCHNIFGIIKKQAFEKLQNQVPLSPDQIAAGISAQIQSVHQQLANAPPFICGELASYTRAQFDVFFNDILEATIKQNFEDINLAINDADKILVKNIVFEILKSTNFLNNFTGLIFIGYGVSEIFPSLLPLQISFVVENRLRYTTDEKMRAQISLQTGSVIRPFAQTDVIDTILTGIDPTLENLYNTNFNTFLTQYNQFLITQIGASNPDLVSRIQNINVQEIVNQQMQNFLETKRIKYIEPLMNAVGTLAKEDLAEMAESLIYLTYLKRRITFAEESVGGPVDVAIISKTDGFIWIKRKHYFSPELNHHFFTNYNK